MKRLTLSERIERLSKLNPETGCIEWQGALTEGYGTLNLSSGSRQLTKKFKAHRLAWELHCGPIPAGMQVCHHCDNRKCINPAHLFIGTNKQNMEDKARKGRAMLNRPRGENHTQAKLTEAGVIEMRRLRKEGRTFTEIARQFGVNPQTAAKAIRGEDWGWLK